MKIELQSVIQREVHKSIRRHVIDGRRQIHKEVGNVLRKYAVAFGIGSLVALFGLWSNVKKEANLQISKEIQTATGEMRKQLEIQREMITKEITGQIHADLEAAKNDFEKQRITISAEWNAAAKRLNLDVEDMYKNLRTTEAQTQNAKKALARMEEENDQVHSRLSSLNEKAEKITVDLEQQRSRAGAFNRTLDEWEKKDLQASIDKAEKFLKATEGQNAQEILSKLVAVNQTLTKLTADMDKLSASAIKNGTPIHIISRRTGNEALTNFQAGDIPVRTTPRRLSNIEQAFGTQDWEIRFPNK